MRKPTQNLTRTHWQTIDWLGTVLVADAVFKAQIAMMLTK